MAIFLVWMASLVLICFTSYVFQPFTDTNRRLPPGPRPLPLIGNLLDIAGGELPHRSLTRLARGHGPLMTVRLGTAGVTIVASSPATIREVLRTHNGSLAGRRPPDVWRGAGDDDNSVVVLPQRRKWRRIGAEHLLSPGLLDGGRRLRTLLHDAILRLVGRVSEVAAGAPVEVGRIVFAALADLQ
uniref:Uncharacterized protein n=1 Tax=Leersia perrieri TaxID=77586 RepID=A0A0D9X6U4_9ORYZ